MTIKEGAGKLVKVTSNVQHATTKDRKKVELYNPEVDYSAPLPQQINPELIGAHPHAALHQQQYNNNNNNQLLITQLKQQQQFTYMGAQIQPSLTPKEEKLNLDANIMKMWQQQDQEKTTTQLSHMLKDLKIDGTTTNENKNLYSIYNKQAQNQANQDISNLWGSPFGLASDQSSFSSNSSNCSSSSTSTSSSSSSSPCTSSSGCSSGGSSSLSPTASITTIVNSSDNHHINTDTSLLIEHAIKNCGNESLLWQQQQEQQAANIKLRENAANYSYKNVNAIEKEYKDRKSDTLWSTQSNEHNNYETLSQYAKISNIWQLPIISGNNNDKLCTDLWKSNDNNCDMEKTTTANPSQLLDPAGIWSLDQTNMTLFGDI